MVHLYCSKCLPYNDALNLVFARTPEAGATVTSTLPTRKLRHGVKKNSFLPPPPGQWGPKLGFEEADWLPGQKFSRVGDQNPTLDLGTHLKPYSTGRALQNPESPHFIFTKPMCVKKEIAICVTIEYHNDEYCVLTSILRTLSIGSRKEEAGRREPLSMNLLLPASSRKPQRHLVLGHCRCRQGETGPPGLILGQRQALSKRGGLQTSSVKSLRVKTFGFSSQSLYRLNSGVVTQM